MLARVGASSSVALGHGRPLEWMMRHVKTSTILLNAQDVYQICITCLHSDTLGMMQDKEFMRGLSSSFQRANQTILNPFQVNLITNTFARAGINISPKELTIQEEEEPSPEAIVNTLRMMTVNKLRDEAKIDQAVTLMRKIIDDFTPSLLAESVVELGKLQCSDAAFMGELAKRACQASDDLSAMNISEMANAIFLVKGVPHTAIMRILKLVEQRCKEFQPEDYINTARGIHAGGPRYAKTFRALVESALEKVESLDAASLTAFLTCFSSLGYQNRQHMEIFVDSLVEVVEDLDEFNATNATIAMVQLRLLTAESWEILVAHLMTFAPGMDPRNIAPIMDMASQVPFETNQLMSVLLDRATSCTRIFTPNQLGEILEIIALYPPAREHPIVQLFGKQARLRLDLLGPTPLAGVCRGLANLGYSDKEFYLEACQTFLRYGFKDFLQLEPILQGLCIEGGAPLQIVKILGGYLSTMAANMSLVDIERANRYMIRLECDDEMVYKALADRVRLFVQEVTPDMPEDLQILLARGAAADMALS